MTLTPLRVFIGHSSKDKPAAERLARGLRERGIDAWFAGWEIRPGDDIVERIDGGLEAADAGVVLFSRHTWGSSWVKAEARYLSYARIEEEKVLIPVMAEAGAWVPPLLRPLARRGVEEVEAIAEALLHRSAGPPALGSVEDRQVERVVISLGRGEDGEGVQVEVRIGDALYGGASHAALPAPLLRARAEFLRGFRVGIRRDPAVAERRSLESRVVELGRQLGKLCLPGESGAALVSLIDGIPLGGSVEVTVEAQGAELLGLPFEALRLPDDRLLAVQKVVVMVRRPKGLAAAPFAPLAGPLKILVAVGAPDEGYTASVVLDQERELHRILDAVEPARALKNAQVRFLEVGSPAEIARAVELDAYHVLHLFCHGGPGELELEDEDGKALPTTPEALIDPLREKGRPIPLVLLNACHGAVTVPGGQTASFAEALLAAGVPAVLAMQTSVSDHYAIRLAGAFYHHLSAGEHLKPSRALAAARRELEEERGRAKASGAPLAQTQPEYATATLFVAGQEQRLADFGLDKVPLQVPPVHHLGGPVPQLGIDELIGRRKELRTCLRTLRDETSRCAGVVLTGIGGVGKSAIAGRAMRRLREAGYLVPAVVGRLDLRGIALAVGAALTEAADELDDKVLGRKGERLAQPDLEDRLCRDLLLKVLAEERIVLVLDDFEQNLETGGGAFLDPEARSFLETLAEAALRGRSRLLLTCRHPVPGAQHYLHPVAIGPLSLAQARKLVLRLPGLAAQSAKALTRILRRVGRHPRVLEFLDALLRGGQGRLAEVDRKLAELAQEQGLDLAATTGDLEESQQLAISLGARDIFLTDLLAIAQEQGIAEALLQAAVSNLPLSPAGLARMLASPDATELGDEPAATQALTQLEELSLVHYSNGFALVERWTAEGLQKLSPSAYPERCLRAGSYRLWQLHHESHALEDAIEATRNFLAGRDFDTAVAAASACFKALGRARQSSGVAALASEVLETLPEEHGSFAQVADAEAQAHIALGDSKAAFRRYEALVAKHEQLASSEPDRADYQRDLSVSYIKMGDLYRALGEGDLAGEAYGKSLSIAERLASSEPDRADYQRDLSVSYDRMGDHYRALGQGEQAGEAYGKSLSIAERLASSEPDRADYQRDLWVSYNKMGDVYRALGQGDQAGEAYGKSLSIVERLASSEPDRADYQRDLWVSYNKVGDHYRALGQGEQAGEAYGKSLSIRERLASSEPDRADYQRDLSISYNKMGDLYRALGQGDQAGEAYGKSLSIVERLASSEPDRADYQRDLSVSYIRLGDLYQELGEEDRASGYYAKDLEIAERLAAEEPDRADYQRDLAISLLTVGREEGPSAGEALRPAHSILLTLRESGRLDPVDEPMIAAVEKRLSERGLL